MKPERPYLSVIVPAYNGADVLVRSLEALIASDLPRECWELIVVDDASTDHTAVIAARYADTVVRLPGRPHGPAYARNRGFEVVRGDNVVFVDADVCVHPTTLRRFAHVLWSEPEVSAVFGAYDDNPAAKNFISQYRNLFHHWVHMQSPGSAETFWAGCGAIRSKTFARAGMYDEWRFPRPQVEDIDLGHRIRALGERIVLRPEIQGTHLKQWTLRQVIATDIRDRGVPWMRLLIRHGTTSKMRSLNLRTIERVNTVMVWMALLFTTYALGRWQAGWMLAVAACLGLVIVVNRRLYRFFARRCGLLFLVPAVALHLTYYLLNGASVVVGWLLHELFGDPRPSPIVEALAEVGVKTWPPVPNKTQAGSAYSRAS